MSDYWTACFAVAERTLRKSLRRRVHFSFSLIQPLMWLLFFGSLMGRVGQLALPHGIDYFSFIVPGVTVMTVLFGASQSGIGIIRDIHSGLFQRIVLSPAPRSAVHLGKCLADIARLMVQAGIIAAIAWILGARYHLVPQHLVLGVIAVAAFGFGYCNVSSIFALLTRKQETMASFVHVTNMPLFFTSTALVPSKAMPPWLASVAQYNPLSLTVDYLRAGMVSIAAQQPVNYGPAAGLIVFALVSFLVAVALYNYSGLKSKWD